MAETLDTFWRRAWDVTSQKEPGDGGGKKRNAGLNGRRGFSTNQTKWSMWEGSEKREARNAL